MKTAIVYDWIDKWGGVERVLLTMAKMFPKADFYTSYYDPEAAPWAKNLKIKTSFIQKLPNSIKKNRILSLPFYPYAFELFNFSGYDLVISISSSFAKSIITKPHTLHICYLLTPTRYFWLDTETYLDNPFKQLGKIRLKKYQEWDCVAAQRPDQIISISKEVQQRVKKFYKRNSEVIYPPFDVEYWEKIKQGTLKIRQKDSKFFIVVSRLEPYKKIDLAINVFNKLKAKLIIVGKGTQMSKLKRLAGNNIEFHSDLSDLELAKLYNNAEALVMPQVEEFGYVSLEAQLLGCPVIAYRKGGAIETILENKTGVFFDQQTTKSLANAVARFIKIEYNLRKSAIEYGKINVERFSFQKFENMFKVFVAEKLP